MPSRRQEAMTPMKLVIGHWKFTLENPDVPSLPSPAEPVQSCSRGACLTPVSLQILGDVSHWPTLTHILGPQGWAVGEVPFRALQPLGIGKPSHRGLLHAQTGNHLLLAVELFPTYYHSQPHCQEHP